MWSGYLTLSLIFVITSIFLMEVIKEDRKEREYKNKYGK